MGGAFVAVADDSTATWWNPAGLAAGPFFEVALGAGATDIDGSLPAQRERGVWFALATPPFGFSYYHLRITDIGQFRTIAPEAGGREDRRAAVPDWSLSASQFGATLVHTVVSGIHVGTTLKYVRAKGLRAEVPDRNPRRSGMAGPGRRRERRRRAPQLRPGSWGPGREGSGSSWWRGAQPSRNGLGRGEGAATGTSRRGVRCLAGQQPRALLVAAGCGRPDAYQTPIGDRRVVAVGAEGWAFGTAARRSGGRPIQYGRGARSRPTRRARAWRCDRECSWTGTWCSAGQTTRAAGVLRPGHLSDDSREIGRFLLHGGSNRRAASQREAHHA